MGALGGGGYSASQSVSKEFHLSQGPVGFGDVNAGAGSGSGLRLTPLMLGIGGAVLVALVFIWKKFA